MVASGKGGGPLLLDFPQRGEDGRGDDGCCEGLQRARAACHSGDGREHLGVVEVEITGALINVESESVNGFTVNGDGLRCANLNVIDEEVDRGV